MPSCLCGSVITFEPPLVPPRPGLLLPRLGLPLSQVDSRIVICIKVKCVDSTAPPEIVFGREVNALRAEIFNLFEQSWMKVEFLFRNALPRWEVVVTAMAPVINTLTLP